MRGTKVLAAAMVVLFGAMSVGCGCAPKAYDVKVSLDDGVKTPAGTWPSLEVDVVAVPASEQSTWSSYSVTEYFKPGNRFRNDANRATLQFSNEDASPKKLKKGDGKWGDWKKQKAEYLYVMAFLPWQSRDMPGAADPRRLVLPLGGCRWSGSTIEIAVKPSGLKVLTPMKAAK